MDYLSHQNKIDIAAALALADAGYSAKKLAQSAGLESMSEILQQIRDFVLSIGASESHCPGIKGGVDVFYSLALS